MARETVTDYVNQIFRDRRYCSNCGAMTPVVGLGHDPQDNARHYCEICGQPYKPSPLRNLVIKEEYGLAIINEGVPIKITKGLSNE